ncbi:MAG: 6-phospho-3-hexuloisomerase [Lachnospiraceae bacterium]|nr:6-phospho-3-hexuloisomerase [Lachnospiraceae bacterium]
MTFHEYTELILKEIMRSTSAINEEKIDEITESIISARNIYCDGLGKSGLVTDSFAMRLSQMGMNALIVSGYTTTAITKEDILIIGSGSGETPSLIEHAKKAKQLQAKVILITTNKKSSLGTYSDIVILIPAPTKKDNTGESMQPMGTLFEQSLGIFFDALVLMLMKKLSISVEEMYKNHNNLE